MSGVHDCVTSAREFALLLFMHVCVCMCLHACVCLCVIDCQTAE